MNRKEELDQEWIDYATSLVSDLEKVADRYGMAMRAHDEPGQMNVVIMSTDTAGFADDDVLTVIITRDGTKDPADWIFDHSKEVDDRIGLEVIEQKIIDWTSIIGSEKSCKS